MSSNALRIVAVVAVLLALLLAMVGYRISRQYAENAEKAVQQAAQAAPQILAVVALKPLAAYKPIPREHVALVPIAVAPADYFTNLDEVSGRAPLTDVDAGAPVTARYFKEGNALARIIPPGHQALALEINEIIAAGGFVRPGDIVDVLVFLRGGGTVAEPQARVLLPAARVLAYEERIIDRPQGLKEDEGGPEERRRRIRTAVLAVPDKDTTRVMLGASLGDVRLSLRAQSTVEADAAIAAEPPVAGDPVPPKADVDKAVTVSDLGRTKPAATTEKKAAPPAAPKVTIYRGSNESSADSSTP